MQANMNCCTLRNYRPCLKDLSVQTFSRPHVLDWHLQAGHGLDTDQHYGMACMLTSNFAAASLLSGFSGNCFSDCNTDVSDQHAER